MICSTLSGMMAIKHPTLGVLDMSFLCLDCAANMIFEKTPSLDVKDFAKI